MDIVTLNVEKRAKTGKGPARRSRKEGRFPAVFYGPKTGEAELLSVAAQEFSKKLGSLEGAHLIRLESEASEVREKMVLLREVQRHPVSGRVLHADFYEVYLNKPIEVMAVLHFVGKAEGVERGGVLQPIVREILVLCLPANIPEFIEIDVSSLDIHDSVHIEDVKLPSVVQAVFDKNYTLVTVVPPTVEEVPISEAAVEGEAEIAAAGEATPAGGVDADKADAAK